jgi:hypothetical protein
MVAEVPALLVEVAAWCIAATAILTFWALVCRTRLCRWLFAALIAEPVTHWLRREMEEVVAPIKAELTLNGGRSLKDRVEQIAAHVGIDE